MPQKSQFSHLFRLVLVGPGPCLKFSFCQIEAIFLKEMEFINCKMYVPKDTIFKEGVNAINME